MNRRVQATIQTAFGKGGINTTTIKQIENYQTATAIDTDADAFSIDIGDPGVQYREMWQRDSEVRVQLAVNNESGVLVPIFTGIADVVQYSTDDQLVSIQGRDLSCLATDTSAKPGRWSGVRPKRFLTKRAKALGFKQIVIDDDISGIGRLFTDASEDEWEFWYRIARLKDRWIWTGPNGALYVSKLAYGSKPAYHFTSPIVAGNNLIYPTQVEIMSNKEQRRREVWVYAERPKIGRRYVGLGRDSTIANWTRKPLQIVTSSIAKTTAEAKKEADIEIFESIVGAEEITLTIHDTGRDIQQNTVALLQIPELGLNDTYYVVGVTRQGGQDGFTQIVRLREQGFAVSKRKPDAPVLVANQAGDPTTGSNKVPGSISAGLTGVRWPDSFVRAANEFHGGWDYATFLGVLLSIAAHETAGDTGNFKNVAGGGTVEWLPYDEFAKTDSSHSIEAWQRLFANKQTNPLNPRYPNSEDAVGPMQLVTPAYKVWADGYGWGGQKKVGEYDGGRWNPDSNIRAGARAFKAKLDASPANPTNSDDIWIGVADYYGGTAGATAAYVSAVKANFTNQFYNLAAAAAASGTATPGTPPHDPPGIGGDSTAQGLAKKLVSYARQGKINWEGGGVVHTGAHPDIVAMAAGNGVINAGGERIQIDPRVFGVMIWMIEGGYSICVSAICSDHSINTTGGRRSAHPDGRACDIAEVNGQVINQRTAKVKSTLISVLKYITGTTQADEANVSLGNGTASLYPTQLISGGYGNSWEGGYDTDCQAYCIPNAATFAARLGDGHTTLGEHTNHFHIGY